MMTHKAYLILGTVIFLIAFTFVFSKTSSPPLELKSISNEFNKNLIVQISQGLLQGKVGLTLSGKSFAQFLGVPYANPPKRFEPPQRVDDWPGIKNATEFGSKCAQSGYEHEVIGEENCLILNIYTPNLPPNTTALLPVLVFVHGGSFQTGGDYDVLGPEYLMETEKLVFVAINYRLGALGFLSTGPLDSENGDVLVSGNNGLKDQTMALKFVQENIHAFGGDNNHVILMGESAGGAAVSLHLLSPLSQGLFQTAVAISGSSLCPWAMSHDPEGTFEKLSALIGCNGTATQKLECLRQTDYKNILQHQQLQKWNFVPMAAFGPVIETNRTGSFLTDSPLALLSQGHVSNPVPFISGVVKQESLLEQTRVILRNETATEELNSNWLKLAPVALMYDELGLEEPELDDISWAIWQYYLDAGETVSNVTRDKVEHMFSDRLFVFPVETQARLYASGSGAPTFIYYFDYAGEHSLADPTPGNPNQTVSHVDDTQYLLRWTFKPSFPVNSTSALFVEKYINLWASFGADFEPTGTWGDAKEWPELSQNSLEGNLTWYEINDKTSLIVEPFHHRLNFWRSLSL